MTNQRHEEDALLREAAVEAQLQLQFRQYSDRISDNIALAEMAYTRTLEIYVRTKVDDVTHKAYSRSVELKLDVQHLKEDFALLGTTQAYGVMSLANRVLALRVYLNAITKVSKLLDAGFCNHNGVVIHPEGEITKQTREKIKTFLANEKTQKRLDLYIERLFDTEMEGVDEHVKKAFQKLFKKEAFQRLEQAQQTPV